MALVMPIVPPCVWPRRVHKQEIHINAKYFACLRWAESAKGGENYVGYIKIHPQWHGIHENVVQVVSGMSLKSAKEDNCSNNTHFCEVF